MDLFITQSRLESNREEKEDLEGILAARLKVVLRGLEGDELERSARPQDVALHFRRRPTPAT